MANRKLRTLLPALAGASVTLLGAAGISWAQNPTFNIPAEPLSQALRDYGRESGRQIIFTEDLVRGRASHQVQGPLAPDAALTALLSGTGLIARYRPSGTIMIEQKPAAKEGGHRTRPAKRTSPLGVAAAAENPATLGEIVVTAQRRSQRIGEVPIAISVLGGPVLDQSSFSGVADALTTVPSVAMLSNSTQGGQTLLSLRGISAQNEAGTSPIGYYLDGVPFSLWGSYLPDESAYDLDRIEVLKGPQGTLYGAGGRPA
jgi:hypothetical protein